MKGLLCRSVPPRAEAMGPAKVAKVAAATAETAAKPSSPVKPPSAAGARSAQPSDNAPATPAKKPRIADPASAAATTLIAPTVPADDYMDGSVTVMRAIVPWARPVLVCSIMMNRTCDAQC